MESKTISGAISQNNLFNTPLPVADIKAEEPKEKTSSLFGNINTTTLNNNLNNQGQSLFSTQTSSNSSSGIATNNIPNANNIFFANSSLKNKPSSPFSQNSLITTNNNGIASSQSLIGSTVQSSNPTNPISNANADTNKASVFESHLNKESSSTTTLMTSSNPFLQAPKATNNINNSLFSNIIIIIFFCKILI